VAQVRLSALTRAFSLAVVRLVGEFPSNRAGFVIGDQLLRAGTSVGANYRAACRARSRKEFVAKMGIVEEEADEAEFWLELAVDSGLVTARRVLRLKDAARRILGMTVSSIRTARRTPRSTPHSAPPTPHQLAGAPDVH
jgi:four helix bundle protein